MPPSLATPPSRSHLSPVKIAAACHPPCARHLAGPISIRRLDPRVGNPCLPRSHHRFPPPHRARRSTLFPVSIVPSSRVSVAVPPPLYSRVASGRAGRSWRLQCCACRGSTGGLCKQVAMENGLFKRRPLPTPLQGQRQLMACRTGMRMTRT